MISFVDSLVQLQAAVVCVRHHIIHPMRCLSQKIDLQLASTMYRGLLSYNASINAGWSSGLLNKAQTRL